ncbi:MAG TPA: hypothetical protein VJG83_05465 [archaeon]|nr:hypothetical protein [archaeon]
MKSTAKEMHTFCTTRDDPLSYFHLIYAFSLFEELVRIASKPTRVNSTKWRFVKPLLKKWKIKVRDIRELTLARETRNCFVHHNGNSDWQPWWEAYNDARRKNPPIKYGDSVRNAFPGGRKNKNGQRMNRLLENINKWYNIIIKISIQIIKEEVKKIPIKIIQ